MYTCMYVMYVCVVVIAVVVYKHRNVSKLKNMEILIILS